MSLRKIPKVMSWFPVEVLLHLMQEKYVNENWIAVWRWESSMDSSVAHLWCRAQFSEQAK